MGRQPRYGQDREQAGSGIGTSASRMPAAASWRSSPGPSPLPSRPKRNRPVLIVNADDFGSSTGVNDAVLEGHTRGVLTSASLMVTGAAFDEAVAMARTTPSLAVGLHLVLVKGRAAAAPERLAHLASPDGRLPDDPVLAGVRLAFDRTVQREVDLEIEAQLARFVATGLPLSHVDGHLNFHLHPAVFPRLVRAAKAAGARGVRIPRDDLRLALRTGGDRIAQKLLWATAFGPLCSWARRRLPAHLDATDRVYGLFQSGHVTVPYALAVVRGLNHGSAELYLHPSTGPAAEALGPNPGDLATLLDGEFRDALQAYGVQLGTYATLHDPGPEGPRAGRQLEDA